MKSRIEEASSFFSELTEAINDVDSLIIFTSSLVEEYNHFLQQSLIQAVNCRIRNSDVASYLSMATEEESSVLLRDPRVAYALFHLENDEDLIQVLAGSIVESQDVLNGTSDQSTCWRGLNVNIGEDLLFDHMADCYSHISRPSNLGGTRMKLESLADSLGRHKPDCWHHICSTNFLVCLRDDLGDSFASGSFAGFPGLTVLANARLDRVTAARLLDSLYHEALHAVIYFFEELYSPLLIENYDRSVKIMSPWSGRELGLNQFVQAVLVWSALIALWSDRDIITSSTEEAASLLKRAENGFASRTVSATLKSPDVSSNLRKYVLDSLLTCSSRFD